MKPIMPSNWKAQRRVLCTFFLGITTLLAMPKSACAQLYVSQSTANTVGEYNANTGTAVNANFITGTGGQPAVSGDGTALFVANSINGTVGKYDATTGVAINANFITGLNGPAGLALSSDGTVLFVENTLSEGSFMDTRLANTTPRREPRLTRT
jgi:DNA-binding beta-propeller fold protein YncE